MAGIYIHIPFCKQACSYCDFYFITKDQLKQPFVDTLVKEIQYYEGSEYIQKPIETIYIGGGTPSLLSVSQLEIIFNELEKIFKLEPKEVTIELNPDDVTTNYLQAIKDIGINRASMGIQSFQPEILGFMNRAHTSSEAVKAFEALHKADFPSFTADLIYGNPGQSEKMLSADVKQLLKYNPPHISAYSLTVEANTRLGKQVELGRITPPEDEEVAAHFDLVYSLLGSAGLEQYEVSNFAVPGKEALHNSNYWRHRNYLGLGPSAHSFWWDESPARRWKNRPDIKQYLEADIDGIQDELEHLDMHTLAEEYLMLGLRTRWGVDLQLLDDKYNYRLNPAQQEWLKNQIEKGVILKEHNKIKMSSKGLKISDLLLVDLLSKQ